MKRTKTICHSYVQEVDPPSLLEEPRIQYPRPKAIGRYVDILMDKWFKKILSAEANKETLLLILRELIPDRDIDDIFYYKGPRRKVNPFIDGHDAVFDVECVGKDGTRFVVEMQKTEQEHFYDRALFYSTFPIQEQVQAASKKLGRRRKSHDEQFNYRPVYLIGFLNFSLHEESDRILYRYNLREKESGELMTDRINYIFLEMTNFRQDEVREENSFAEKISYAFTHMGSLKERPAALMERVFQLLFEACDIQAMDNEDQTEYKTDIMTTAMDRENLLYSAEHRGEKRGIAIGEKNAKERFALKLLLGSSGMTIEQVSEYTELSVAELQELLANATAH